MTAIAVLLSIVWFITAFVVRIAIQVRRTGDSGLRLRAASPVAATAKVGFIVATLLVAAGPALVAGDVVGELGGLGGDVGRAAGLALTVLGILLTFVAQLAMGRSWRIGVDPAERTDLVTGGVFGIVRNPIFSTMAITAVGLLLAVPSVPGAVGLALTLVTLEVQVRGVEEPYLRRTHGPAYATYEAQVGRFLPALGRR